MSLEQKYFQEGVSALKQRDRNRAYNSFKKVLEINPNNDMAWIYLAYIITDKEKSLAYLDKAIKINPLNEKAWALKKKFENTNKAENITNSKSDNAKNIKRHKGGKARPDKATTIIHSIIAFISIIAWFKIDAGPDIFYGQYGGLIFGAICAIIAVFKKRNPIVWFAWGSWFVIASLIVILFLPPLHDRLCPYCREGISSDAVVCPHCQRDVKAYDEIQD